MSAIAKQSKAAGKKRSKSQEIWRRFKKNTRAVVGLGIVAVLVLCAVLFGICSCVTVMWPSIVLSLLMKAAMV